MQYILRDGEFFILIATYVDPIVALKIEANIMINCKTQKY